MTKKTKLFIFAVLIIALCITSCGCISAIFHTHDEADKIYVSYLERGYYWFEDDNYRSYNETIYSGDISRLVKGHTANTWINYVHSLEYIEDEKGKEIFYDANEVVARGGGDCEDLAILMARGLHELGYDTCIIIQKSHVLAGINATQVENRYKGVKIQLSNYKTYKNIRAGNYYALECTTDWGIGEYDEKPLIYEKIYVIE